MSQDCPVEKVYQKERCGRETLHNLKVNIIHLIGSYLNYDKIVKVYNKDKNII